MSQGKHSRDSHMGDCGMVGCICGTVTGQGLAQSKPASGQPIVCGFLTSCRKDFIIQVQVILRVHLLKLGLVTQRKDLC